MEDSRLYLLSHPQKRIWYSEVLHPNTSFANLSGRVVFKHKVVDFGILEKAINMVIERYDALRIRIVETSEYDVGQYVSNYIEKSLEIIEENQLDNWMRKQSRTPFSLIDSDLFYFALIRFSESEFGYYFNYHHIICDAMSVTLLNRQIFNVYNNLVDCINLQLEIGAPSFIEFLERDKKYLNSEKYHQDKSFWLNEFKEIPIPSSLYNQSTLSTIKAERLLFNLGDEISKNINSFCKENNTTIFRFFMSIFYIYLFRTTESKDFVIATGHHNRISKREKELVGMTVSTLPIRIFLDDNMDFITLLKNVTEKISNCLAHQCYPYDLLVADLRERGCESSDLLNIMLSHIPSLTEDYEVSRYTSGYDSSLLNIKINPNQTPRQFPIEIGIDYRLEIFGANDIKRLFSRIKVLVKDITSNPMKKICELEIISIEEKDCIINKFNSTFVEYDENRCFHQYFSEQALKTPDNIALVYKNESYTYSKLNKITDQLAIAIRSKGIKQEAKVAIIAERSAQFVIGILAILKAGAVYLPIDQKSPQERIDFVLKDAKVKLILSQNDLKAKALNFKGDWLDLSDETLYLKDTDGINNINNLTDAAYIIYTSGTTGNPKGVVIEHRSLLNFCIWYINFYEISKLDNQAAFCSFTFDVSIGELLPSLMIGATVHIIPEEIRLSPYAINKYFEKQSITVACFPTRMGEIFLESTENNSLRILTLAGERLHKYKLCKCKLVNAYGPTEATIYSTVAIINGECENISIGKPVLNTYAYVVDRNEKLVPIGVYGQLWLSGIQIARGYLNQQELTNEKFIPNPFSKGEESSIVYKTGDLVKWLPDGNLDFSGRMDGQVKIRGFRVELSEIEHMLMQLLKVKETVILDYCSVQGVTDIQAFVVVTDEIDEEDMMKFLRAKLPDYMIPKRIIKIKSIPLTQNGKTDKQALRQMLVSTSLDTQDEMVLPKTSTQQKLHAMWKVLFKVEQISVTKSFFDLGGDSLFAIRLFIMIKETFKASLPYSIIFNENTIEMLSRVIDKESVNDNSIIVCIRKGKGNNPLFCIHDFSGEILSYSKLVASMKEDESIYGIRYPLDFNYQKKNLEALAGEYVKQIKSTHLEGNYRLIGYSSGGVIAYEVARQLLEQNQQVCLLALLDTPNYSEYPKVINNIFFSVGRYALNWLSILSLKDKFKFITVNIKSLTRRIFKDPSKTKKVDFSVFSVQKSMKRLLSVYDPKHYPGKLILVRAKKKSRSMDQHLGWSNLVKEIDIYEVGGNHISIMNEENSHKIADIIKDSTEGEITYEHF